MPWAVRYGLLVLCLACGATPNPARERAAVAPSVELAAERATPAGPAAPVAESTEVPDEAQPATAVATGEELAGAGTASASVARVAGQAVSAGELIAFWYQRDPDSLRDMLEQLALSRLVVAEASRMGLVLAPEPVEAAWSRALAELAERAAQETPGLELEGYIRETLGREPSSFREELRQEILLEALASRVVRAWMLCEERAVVRVIVTETEVDMDKVRAALEAGGDFAELAREHSQEESATSGGLLPPIVRSQAALSRLAFLTEVGELGGPVGEQGRIMMIRVEERPTPLDMTAGWTRLGPAVEASLAADAVRDPEYWQWKAAIGRRYEVDFSPLLDLVGEPLPMESK